MAAGVDFAPAVNRSGRKVRHLLLFVHFPQADIYVSRRVDAVAPDAVRFNQYGCRTRGPNDVMAVHHDLDRLLQMRIPQDEAVGSVTFDCSDRFNKRRLLNLHR